jgi:hypothetical protein
MTPPIMGPMGVDLPVAATGDVEVADEDVELELELGVFDEDEDKVGPGEDEERVLLMELIELGGCVDAAADPDIGTTE